MTHSQLHLLHLSSPALPVGAYAYSQGLEYAIEAGWLDDEELSNWLSDGLMLGIAQLDLPVLLRALDALKAANLTALNLWNDRILASRETAELLLEDQQIGAALWRLLETLDTRTPPALTQRPAYAVAFAIAVHQWEIDEDAAVQGYAYSWLENQVTAATKLVPLGQTAAQRLLLQLMKLIPEACTHAKTVADDELGLSLPGLAMASCRHERQHTRLFRS
ncbi:urease accessory UreF family protein [Congregibacter brevis]|uniref:Urease accessory protein UreF n=1 Tax=Congregibacter brevis TaxID=3081201 RepID=A0ABZ0I8R3_9GAMM|nr:urease accessory UreF family protein [Congregibacter sp. IMCC45268]